MFRIITPLAAAFFALAAASCCCTSDSQAPSLRRLPQFQEIEQAQPEYTPGPIYDTK